MNGESWSFGVNLLAWGRTPSAVQTFTDCGRIHHTQYGKEDWGLVEQHVKQTNDGPNQLISSKDHNFLGMVKKAERTTDCENHNRKVEKTYHRVGYHNCKDLGPYFCERYF